MKLNFKIGNITVGESKLENVEVGVQYTAEELVNEYDLIKKVLKELPATINDLKAGAIAFNQADKEITDIIINNNNNEGDVA